MGDHRGRGPLPRRALGGNHNKYVCSRGASPGAARPGRREEAAALPAHWPDCSCSRNGCPRPAGEVRRPRPRRKRQPGAPRSLPAVHRSVRITSGAWHGGRCQAARQRWAGSEGRSACLAQAQGPRVPAGASAQGLPVGAAGSWLSRAAQTMGCQGEGWRDPEWGGWLVRGRESTEGAWRSQWGWGSLSSRPQRDPHGACSSGLSPNPASSGEQAGPAARLWPRNLPGGHAQGGALLWSPSRALSAGLSRVPSLSLRVLGSGLRLPGSRHRDLWPPSRLPGPPGWQGEDA